MRRAVRWLVTMLVGVPTAYFLAATLGAVINTSGGTRETPNEVEVLLIAGPIHYDFLLPLNEATLARFSELEAHGLPIRHPNARWLLIGWGAREFYTTTGSYSDVNPRAILRGVFGDSSVIRADVLGDLYPDVAPLRVSMSAAQYDRLTQAMEATFDQRPDSTWVGLNTPGFTKSDRFFAANGRFHLFATCNTWVGKMLRAAGLPFGAWVPLPFAVTLSHHMYLSQT